MIREGVVWLRFTKKEKIPVATVKWCRKPEDEKIDSYGAGAKYF